MKLLKTGEAAARLGISQQQIIRMVDTGQLRGARIPGTEHRRIPEAAIAEYLAAHPEWAALLREKGEGKCEPS